MIFFDFFISFFIKMRNCLQEKLFCVPLQNIKLKRPYLLIPLHNRLFKFWSFIRSYLLDFSHTLFLSSLLYLIKLFCLLNFGKRTILHSSVKKMLSEEILLLIINSENFILFSSCSPVRLKVFITLSGFEIFSFKIQCVTFIFGLFLNHPRNNQEGCPGDFCTFVYRVSNK